MHFVYVIYSEKCDRYYIGFCIDVPERLRRHNAGMVTATKNCRPYRLRATKSFSQKQVARQLLADVSQLIGKFMGIFLISYLAVKFKLASISNDMVWQHILGISLLRGIGFTMSMFIANLAFSDDMQTVVSSKMSILLASLIAAVFGLFILRRIRPKIPN